MCVVNSLVLADLGMDAAATDVPGGRVATDADGRPTGLLEERAQLLVGSLVYPYPLAELTDAIDRAAAQYLTEGVTSCTEAGIGGGWIAHSPVELAAYQAARDTGRLGVRVELMMASEVLHPLGAHADDGLVAGLDLGIRTGFGDDWLRLGAVKIFADGSLVGRTAALIDPYAVRGPAGQGRGYLQADAADLQATIIAAHRSGWQVATHAIGDLAIDVVLDAYERALAQYPRRDPRHRIEHFAVVQPRQVARAAGLGVIAVPQGRFATELGDGMLAAVGPAGTAGSTGSAPCSRRAWCCRAARTGRSWPARRCSASPTWSTGGPPPARLSTPVRRSPHSRRCTPRPAGRPTPAARSTSRARSPQASSPTWWCCPRIPTAVSPDRIAGLTVLATLVDGQSRLRQRRVRRAQLASAAALDLTRSRAASRCVLSRV